MPRFIAWRIFGQFLSRPVLRGFTSAAALIIALKQVPLLLGVQLPKGSDNFSAFVFLIEQVEKTHLATFTIALGTIAILWVCKVFWPKFPAVLLVTLLGICLAAIVHTDQLGVNNVGPIPTGLPTFKVPVWDFSLLFSVTTAATSIAFIGFVEAISIGKGLARSAAEEPYPNREFFALGCANFAGSFSGCYPVSGSFSRSAVAARASAISARHNWFAATIVIMVLLWLTPWVRLLPVSVIAAVIFVSVLGLLEIGELRRLRRFDRKDLFLLGLAFVSTWSFGVQNGLLIGVGASLITFVFRTTRPHYALLGRLPGTEIYRNVLRYSEAQRCEGVLLLRIDAQFYFGNVSFLRETLRVLERDLKEKLHFVVLDASGINYLDSSAEAALRELVCDYKRRGICLKMASVKGPVRDVMERSGLAELIGEENLFFRVHEAAQSCHTTTEV
ncbi:MAG: STAS domain-containing protein [Myxococcales bacterium]|nr:MAG: STAS domain-containing protein [Myxococcales bacterium]